MSLLDSQEQQKQSQQPQHDEVDLEWEEWDGSSPFLHHCIAGSIAGVAEHVLLFPVDTVKTHMQAYCSVCPKNPDNIATPNAAMKAVCTGPPNTTATTTSSMKLPNPAATVSSVVSSVTSSSSSSSSGAGAGASSAPHGMWSTMSNLINHGHSHAPQPSNNFQLRQSATAYTAAAAPTSTSTAVPSLTSNSMKSKPFSKGYIRLWRGVQTMTTGCIPAHALYFSSYEYTKARLSTTTIHPKTGLSTTQLGAVGASIAGATSALLHDLVMTPMDTIKQRMQLGHYNSMTHAFKQIIKFEGWSGLYRSFGVTVMTNLPYGMVMVSTNEFLRSVLMDIKRQRSSAGMAGEAVPAKPAILDLQTTMLAGCGAGMVAAAVTAPLDRVKTRLQTQRLLHAMPTASSANPNGGGPGAAAPACPKASTLAKASMEMQPHYTGFNDALSSIIKEEGHAGLWRGLAPRLLTHTPAVAISWTAYEAAKRMLHECL